MLRTSLFGRQTQTLLWLWSRSNWLRVQCTKDIAPVHPDNSHKCQCEANAHAGTLSGLQYLWPEQEGANWATPQQPLGQVLYDTYTEDDYHIIWETYSYSDFSWDFGKLNSSAAQPRHSRLSPAITKVYKQQVGHPALLMTPDICSRSVLPSLTSLGDSFAQLMTGRRASKPHVGFDPQWHGSAQQGTHMTCRMPIWPFVQQYRRCQTQSASAGDSQVRNQQEHHAETRREQMADHQLCCRHWAVAGRHRLHSTTRCSTLWHSNISKFGCVDYTGGRLADATHHCY